MMWDWGGFGAFWMIVMMLSMIIFWGLVIAGIVFAIRYLSTGSPGPRPEGKSNALELLNERYARGEIDTAEYEEKKRQLAS